MYGSLSLMATPPNRGVPVIVSNPTLGLWLYTAYAVFVVGSFGSYERFCAGAMLGRLPSGPTPEIATLPAASRSDFWITQMTEPWKNAPLKKSFHAITTLSALTPTLGWSWSTVEEESPE